MTIPHALIRRVPSFGRALLCFAIALTVGAGPALAGARPMRFKHLSAEDGLSQTTVLCMLQDERGFLWLGTEDGLNRFDGYGVVVYRHNPADPASLPGDVIWALAQDPSGDIWVGTEGGGVARWDHRTGRFLRYGHDATNASSLSSDAVRALSLANGQLWVGTRGGGLNRLDTRTGRVVRYRHDAANPRSLASDDVYVVTQDRSGRILVGTDNGMSAYDKASDGFVHTRWEQSNPASLSDNRVRAIAEDRDGGLWIGTDDGLNLMDRATRRVTRFAHDASRAQTISDNRVRAIQLDADGRLWVATDHGLNLLDRRDGTFAVYRHDPSSPESLGGDRLMSLYQDRGGILWAGTRTAGADRWNPATWSFGHFTTSPGDPNGLSENNVTAFAEDARGTLYIGTLGSGLNLLNRTTGEFGHYRAKSGPAAKRLSDDSVMALLTDRQGAVWVGTYGGGLDRIDPVSGRVTAYRHDERNPDTLSADGVVTIFEDHRGRLWVGTYGGGLNALDPATGRVTRVGSGTGSRSISSPRITCVTEDSLDRLWIGTDGGGLVLLEPESGLVREFQHDVNDPASLSSNAVFSLYLDEHNTLWVGTRGGGLNRLRLGSVSPKARFQHYSTHEGLPNNVIYGIVPDEDGHLWLSTNGGLAHFDTHAGAFTSYGVNHGLQAAEFNFGAHYRSREGELYFGGINGYNAFFPARLARNTRPPAVLLTQILKDGKPIPMLSGGAELPRIDLGWRDDSVTFEFAALDFASPERNRYQYLLEGTSAGWINLGTDRRVTFTDPGPGQYVLRVRAANNDGVWSERDMAVGIAVEAPPWQRWWAYALYALAFGAVVFGTFWSQHARIVLEEKHSAALEDQVNVRTRQLAERNTELEDANARLRNASLTDPLTGLRNRRFLFEHVTGDVALALRRSRGALVSGSPTSSDIAFLMIDIDRFKPVNDAFGHQAGDEVLLKTVELLTAVCRSSDVLIRWGGDEFLLVARDTDHEQAAALAERVRAAIKEHACDVRNGQKVHVTCSVGFASFPFLPSQPDAVTWEDVLSIADHALYTAKRRRDAWVGLIAAAETPSSIALRLLGRDPFELEAAGMIRVVSSEPIRPVALAS